MTAIELPGATSASSSTENRQIPSYVNLPEDCLKAKLGPLLTRAESKDTFMSRVGEIYPITSKKYLLIERAYDITQRAFKDKKRDSGEQYFEHLRASALFALVHLRETRANVIAAILLHDILEDIPEIWDYHKLATDFNKKIAELVWWVTKPPLNGDVRTSEDVDRKYHRKLDRAPRKAMFVKLPERLHNLITIWSQNEDKVRRKVSETRDFIVPLAQRHGILIHEYEDVLSKIEECLATGSRPV